MAVQLKRKFFTAKEYLEMERSTPEKNEYFNGDIFAMAGASRRHNLIGTNVSRMLSAQLRKRPCEVYANDMRVKVRKTGLNYETFAQVCYDLCKTVTVLDAVNWVTSTWNDCVKPEAI